MCVVVFLVGALGSLWLRPRLSVDNPGGAQQIVELLFTNPLGFGIQDLLEENAHDKKGKVCRDGRLRGGVHSAGEYSQRFSAIFGAHGGKVRASGLRHRHLPVFQLAGNQAPYSRLLHAHVCRFSQDVGDWLLGILLFPVELISTAARILSLTVRLWANIFASDLLYVIFLGLLVAPVTWGWERSPALGVALGIFPALIPIAFIGLHIFVAIIQTYVFTLLPSIYIGIATADEH